jgi:myo-inositol catabolism protein IolS
VRYTKLGRTDIEVSVIALGCYSFGGGPFWGQRAEDDSIETIRAALDEGINFFDTAEAYGDGDSEIILGRALLGRRPEAVIATKVSASHLGPADLRAACEASLRRLNTDYIDLYQIHWPSRTIPLDETMKALQSLQEDGKVRAIGVCNFGILDLSDALQLGPVVTDQLPYSLIWRAIEYEILPKCLETSTGILCYSPLAQGLLSGAYTCAEDVPTGRSCTRWFSDARPMARHGEPGCEAETFAALARIRAISDRLLEPMTNVAIAWLLSRPGVTSVLAGARTPAQLRVNAQAAELDLGAEVLDELTAVTEEVKEKIGSNPDMWQSESRFR